MLATNVNLFPQASQCSKVLQHSVSLAESFPLGRSSKAPREAANACSSCWRKDFNWRPTRASREQPRGKLVEQNSANKQPHRMYCCCWVYNEASTQYDDYCFRSSLRGRTLWFANDAWTSLNQKSATLFRVHWKVFAFDWMQISRRAECDALYWLESVNELEIMGFFLFMSFNLFMEFKLKQY